MAFGMAAINNTWNDDDKNTESYPNYHIWMCDISGFEKQC